MIVQPTDTDARSSDRPSIDRILPLQDDFNGNDYNNNNSNLQNNINNNITQKTQKITI